MSAAAVTYVPAITGQRVIRDLTGHDCGWLETCPLCGAANTGILDRGPVRLVGQEWIANCCRTRGDAADLRALLGRADQEAGGGLAFWVPSPTPATAPTDRNGGAR